MYDVLPPSTLRRGVALAAGLALSAALAACDRKPSQPPTPTSSESAQAAPVASGPLPGVTPVSESHAASSAGPSDGTTAIGGVAGSGGGGSSSGGAPAATGGDGAASAPR